MLPWLWRRLVWGRAEAECFGVGGLAVFDSGSGRYWLIGPAQVVCRWIGWPRPIVSTFSLSLGATAWVQSVG